MDKRFLPSSYKKELYLKITPLSQKNLKIEECIRQFDQVQMRVGLNEELELEIARIIKGLSPNIANKVDLQLYFHLMMCAILQSKLRSNLRI